jgi:hypothetical protein
MIDYVYELSIFPNGVDVEQLHNELMKAQLVYFDGLMFDGVATTVRCYEKLDADKLTRVMEIITTHDGGIFIRKMKEIDSWTQTLIASGFTFDGKRFSLSYAAQLKLNELYQIRDSLVYPVEVNTIDDLDCYNILNSEMFNDFYKTSVNALISYVNLGTLIKDRVRSAKTFDEINNIVVGE